MITALQEAAIIADVASDWLHDEGLSVFDGVPNHVEQEFWAEVADRVQQFEDDGIAAALSLDDVDAGTALGDWNERLHPRDSKGRFAEVGVHAPKQPEQFNHVTFQVPGRQWDSVKARMRRVVDAQPGTREESFSRSGAQAMLNAMDRAETITSRGGAIEGQGYRINLPVESGPHVHKILLDRHLGGDVGATRRDLEQGMRRQYNRELNPKKIREAKTAARERTEQREPQPGTDGSLEELLARYDGNRTLDTVKAIGAVIRGRVEDRMTSEVYEVARRARSIPYVGVADYWRTQATADGNPTVNIHWQEIEAVCRELGIPFRLSPMDRGAFGSVMLPSKPATWYRDQITQKLNGKQRDIVRDELKKAGVRFGWLNTANRTGPVASGGTAAVHVTEAVKYIPTAWSRGLRAVTTRSTRSGGGSYNPVQQSIKAGNLDVAIHEYTHHIDHTANPNGPFGDARELLAWHAVDRGAESKPRVPLRSLPGGRWLQRDAVGFDGRFADAYQGRIYNTFSRMGRQAEPYGNYPGGTHELATVGMQQIFHRYDRWHEDPETIDVMLGTIAATGRRIAF